MEIPDVLVVTKADLGPIAQPRAARPARALRVARRARTPVVAVSSVPPPQGHRRARRRARRATARALDLAAARGRARAGCGALADFAAEHGERGLRALGGRRAAERWLDEQEPGLDVPALERRLEQRALEAS